MACEKCGLKKGHMSGCDNATQEKRGGKQKKPEKGRDTRDKPMNTRKARCLHTWGTNPIEHPEFRHVCINDKGHGGGHLCGGCGSTN